jgi:hypothetical protein
MEETLARIEQRIGIEARYRLKTVNTIVEKLRRERTRLSEMQDIAGLRVVEPIGLSGQDALVAWLAALFPGAKVVDRRQRPSHGYRAVHVIAKVAGHSVEVQVRTTVQDAWAQAMEKVSDVLGREVRYGGGALQGRQRIVVDLMQQLVVPIAIHESDMEELIDPKPLPQLPTGRAHAQQQLARAREQLVVAERAVGWQVEELRRSLSIIRETLAEIEDAR